MRKQGEVESKVEIVGGKLTIRVPRLSLSEEEAKQMEKQLEKRLKLAVVLALPQRFRLKQIMVYPKVNR